VPTTPDLDDTEKAAVIALLKRAIAESRYIRSRRKSRKAGGGVNRDGRRPQCQSQPKFSRIAKTPGQWRVEWFGDDSRCELQIFTGPTARREA
jgi:hypothetical protein